MVLDDDIEEQKSDSDPAPQQSENSAVEGDSAPPDDVQDVSSADSQPEPPNSPIQGACPPPPSAEPCTTSEQEARNAAASPFPDSSAATQLIHSCTELESDEDADELEHDNVDPCTPTEHDENEDEYSSPVALKASAPHSPPSTSSTSKDHTETVLPWGAHKERSPYPSSVHIDMDIRPGEYVMRTLFAEFTVQAERKIEVVMAEPQEKPLSKSLQRGEDAPFDQLLGSFGSVAEHCLPSLLKTLFAWYERQISSNSGTTSPASSAASPEQKRVSTESKGKANDLSSAAEGDVATEKRDLAVEFLFCLVLIEILKQLPFHPGQEDLVTSIENLAFRHFKYRESVQSSPNADNIHIMADLYAEVIGVLAQSRFMSVRARFMTELNALRSREPSQATTQSVISLLMGMKFFRVKMVPIEEFEASFQFMQECAQYFLEVKDKDIKHALAGLFVEILIPVAASVKNEVNVPCLKNFVDMLYPQTLDMCTKNKHRLAIFPLVTCLLCVSQKTFFLQYWHYFLAMCLSHLKNRDPKMSRVALESLYRLLWVYMIRIKCESNSATQSRLQSIVNSLFPKGSKAVMPRDTPLNIFVKIIQFIAQERLDFAMKDIVFELLSVGRSIKVIMTPERMSIGLRAFLVVTDSLQQKEGEPPMPRTVGVLPSGSTLRVKKTYLNKMLTEDTARSIGMSNYFSYVRRTFDDILRALDSQFGRPLMMTNTQNVNKEPDELISGERKPRIDLFRTCVAAIPRLIPDGMTGPELVDLLSRLTVHMDEELRGLAYQSLQTLVMDFPDWRDDVIRGFTQFIVRDIPDTSPQLVDQGLRILLQLLTNWKNAPPGAPKSLDPHRNNSFITHGPSYKSEPAWAVTHVVEGFALVMLCHCRLSVRRLAVHILKEAKALLHILNTANCSSPNPPVIDVIDKCCAQVLERCYHLLSPAEKAAAMSTSHIDLQWIADRNSSVWTAGYTDENCTASRSSSCLNLSGVDPWSACLFGLLEEGRVVTQCPAATKYSWPVVFARLNTLFTVVDPTPVSDNRASLLRSSAPPKRPANDKDVHLWRNYVSFSFRVVPTVPSPVVRCASPDLSLSTSPDSLLDRIESKSPGTSIMAGMVNVTGGSLASGVLGSSFSSFSSNASSSSTSSTSSLHASPGALYKLVVPLLRCESTDIRDAVVQAIGRVNPEALKDLMEELVPYVREAVDRKQENMRRRRRRDALRLQLVKVFELVAEHGTFGISQCVLDRDSQSLHPTFVEYVEGARQYLESEPDKDSSVVKEVKLHFCDFLRKMLKSFSMESRRTLLKRDLHKKLFWLLNGWTTKYMVNNTANASGKKCCDLNHSVNQVQDEVCSELEFAALQAMSALLSCGPCFTNQGLCYEGIFYPWLDTMLDSSDEKVSELARDTAVLLLECNPDVGSLLDWAIDRCYTGSQAEADGCFLSLAAIFSAREYPCDSYVAVINVTLMATGCPRPEVHEAALQLLQVLDKRFFGAVLPLATDGTVCGRGRETLDLLLSNTYCRSQQYLSRQLSQLHPQLTMPMFSEVSHRLQTARPEVRQLLLQYLLPWLYNMELIDPNVPPGNPLSYFQCYSSEGRGNCSNGRREGWGSAEATEMILNNVFYITAKFADNHPKEVEALWAALCTCWPNNLKVILRYLLIVSGMSPEKLLPYAKRVAVYVARARPEKLLDEVTGELQAVETLNCLIERTETPPFYRLTAMRKASSHSDGPGGVSGNQGDVGGAGGLRADMAIEKGTIHTKRHSGEEHIKTGTSKSDSALKAMAGFGPQCRAEKVRTVSGPAVAPMLTQTDEGVISSIDVEVTDGNEANNPSNFESASMPYPLPMPEFGGYFAPLTEFLPDISQPISGFHRCNLAVMLLADVVIDGVDVDWSIHVPLMLHMAFLGLDHTRPLVHEHCRRLLLNLLLVLADHNDSFTVARTLLNCKTASLGLGLPTPSLPVIKHNFTESDVEFDLYLQGNGAQLATPGAVSLTSSDGGSVTPPPVIVTTEENSVWKANTSSITTPDIVKSLIYFLSSRGTQPLWGYEDITAKVWSIHSAEQMDVFMQYILRVFRESLPHALISERWAQTALQLGLSCSSRHYAGRSLQIYRSLRVPITSRMLSDILSRLVETVAEQGEDMQGYVTELLLTLEAAVDSLESDFRSLDLMKEIFKSTPNLNNKDQLSSVASSLSSKRNAQTVGVAQGATIAAATSGQLGHGRSTSYSVSYGLRKTSGSPASETKGRGASDEVVGRSVIASGPCASKIFSSNLSRSRSAQSLKLLGDQASQDDKLTILAQLFWLAVSLLESDFEHEFLLALRLLNRVLHRLPLDRPDCRDKVEKLQQQLKWNGGFPGVHSLLLKGCTNPSTYEPTIELLSRFTLLLDLPVVDPSQSLAFPLNVMALLPYLLHHYEDANQLCVQSAENIAQVSAEKSKKLENLGTVMSLYSRRTFSKESFQWTKCVVKYLYDTYAHFGLTMLAFLVEVLEKGPAMVQLPILNIIHCMLHYVDLNSSSSRPINSDLLRVIAKYIEGPHWRESLKILKLVVTRSSTLVAPPLTVHPTYWENSNSGVIPHPSFADSEVFMKKELPGRTMDFTYDLSQTPVIGRKYTEPASREKTAVSQTHSNPHNASSPRRSVSLSPADSGNIAGWKRPWLCQSRVRECLVNLLTTCGQRVGLPKSPSLVFLSSALRRIPVQRVIFSQSSDLMERQSSMASSTEEVSAPNNDLSGGSRRDDAADQFGVFKDFDFLEYESESVEGESTDNFNWGVRRRPLSDGGTDVDLSSQPVSENLVTERETTPVLPRHRRVGGHDESSDDEVGSESPLDEVGLPQDYTGAGSTAGSAAGASGVFPPSSLSIRERTRHDSGTRSDTSGSSAGDLGDVTPCNASPSIPAFRAYTRGDAEEVWRRHMQGLLMLVPTAPPLRLFQLLRRLARDVCIKATGMTWDVGRLLSAPCPALCTPVGQIAELLASGKAEPPLVWFSYEVLSPAGTRFTDQLRFGALEVQEHLETFLDRRDAAIESLNSVRSSMKMQLGNEPSGVTDVPTSVLVEAGRSLYKLLFQLVLLLEATHKMVNALSTTAKACQLTDVSNEVSSLESHLVGALDDGVGLAASGNWSSSGGADSSGTPTPTPSPAHSIVAGSGGSKDEAAADGEAGHIIDLLKEGKWNAALGSSRRFRTSLLGTDAVLAQYEDDITTILHVYCRHLAKDRPDIFVITRSPREGSDAISRLLEALFQMLAVLGTLEPTTAPRSPAPTRAQLDSLLQRTDC
ncbi:Hypothetical predicted protein [Cloeon dipterum]|uniref:Protein furry n=1 Tax=Cloeon dipterum TaxID=197152 RepID=A0A8S1BVF6_9INSE|nr:Hypothetical predicted protein [Cloeon dipterum]